MTHEQIDRMVREANPVRDPNTLGSVAMPVLKTPLERRTEMQTDYERKIEVRKGNRWGGPLVGIAAAVAVLVAGLLFVLTRDDTPVAEPAPNAWSLGHQVPLAPRAYFIGIDIDRFSGTNLRGTFVIEGNGWEGFHAGVTKAGVSMFAVMVGEVWDGPCDEGDSAPAGTSAKALADQFAAMPGFTTLERLTPVSAFGHDGYHLVLEVPGGCTGDSRQPWSVGNDRWSAVEGQIEEYWFLDVEGTTVMVAASWFPKAPEEDLAELRAVLDTLVITS